MQISQDQSQQLRSIPEAEFRAFLAHPLSKYYKDKLSDIYRLTFNKTLESNKIPMQPQLFLMILQQGPYSAKIDKYIQQAKNLSDENQRKLLYQLFADNFRSNNALQDIQGRSLLQLIGEFQKIERQNKIPQNLPHIKEQQQSQLIQDFKSMHNDHESSSSQESKNSQSQNSDIFQSFIRDSNSKDQFVDFPNHPEPVRHQDKPIDSKIHGQKTESTEIEEINQQKYDKQLNQKTKIIHKNKKHRIANQVKKEPGDEKIFSKEKASNRITSNNKKLSQEKTPFMSHPDDEEQSSSKDPIPHRLGDNPTLVQQRIKFLINQNPGKKFNRTNPLAQQKPIKPPISEKSQFPQVPIGFMQPRPCIPNYQIYQFYPPLQQNLIEENRLLKQRSQKIAKIHQNLLKKHDSVDQNRTIAKEVHQKYNNKLSNDIKPFNTPYEINKWLNKTNANGFLSQHLNEAKTKLLESSPIQPRFPLLIPTLSSDLLNQQRHYLSLFQFYQIHEEKSQVFIHFNSIYQFIDSKQIIKQTKAKIIKSQRLKSLADCLASDLQILGVDANQNGIQKFICEYFYREHRPLNESLTLNNPVLPFTLKREKQSYELFKFIQNRILQSDELQVIPKNKLLSFFNLKQTNYNNLRQRLPSTTAQLGKIGQAIIYQVVKAVLNDNRKIIEEIRVEITKNLVEECRYQLQKIGIFIKFQFQPQSSPFMRIINYQVIPIKLEANELIEFRIQQISELIDKEMILEKILSQGIGQKTEQIAFSHHYTMQVKKQYQSITALHYFAENNLEQLEKQLKNKSFMNFLAKNVNFGKVLQRFGSSIESFPNKQNQDDLISHGYQTMERELNIMEMDLNQFCVSIKAHVWFHSFAVGYIIKNIVAMAELKNEIERQSIEKIIALERSILESEEKSQDKK